MNNQSEETPLNPEAILIGKSGILLNFCFFSAPHIDRIGAFGRVGFPPSFPIQTTHTVQE